MGSTNSNGTGEVVARLYAAFARGDGAAMQACYAPDASFRDEVFTLQGAAEIGAMWQMLLAGGGDLRIEVSDVSEDATSGRAHWDAYYTFNKTGRKVINRIDATFVVADGLITEHVDAFNFWSWSRQALGPMGTVLGWSPVVRSKVRSTARGALDGYRAAIA